MKVLHSIKILAAFIFVVIFVFFMSCETTEEINDFPIIKPQIVVYGFISPDSAWSFQVSKSLSVLDNAETEYLNNALVDVYEAGNKLFRATHGQEKGFYTWGGLLPEPGHTYSIKVKAAPLPDVEAECTVPDRVEILQVKGSIKDSFTYYDPFMKKAYGNLKGTLSIRIHDPENTNNYYLLSIYAKDTFIYWDPFNENDTSISENFYTGSPNDNPLIENIDDRYYIFSDQLIQGETFDFDINLTDYHFYKNKIYIITLMNVDKNMYLYYRSKAIYDQRSENPFAEPVQVYSNVKNGFGVFGAYRSSRKYFSF